MSDNTTIQVLILVPTSQKGQAAVRIISAQRPHIGTAQELAGEIEQKVRMVLETHV